MYIGTDSYTSRPLAIELLAECLIEGTLVLFLGAGASSGAKLPGWSTLVDSLRNEFGMPAVGSGVSADALQVAADEVRRKHFDGNERGFAELVRKCLYRGVKLDDSLLGDRLLTACGALMAGSRRGNVKRVVNFNFDSVLEWYMSLHGFVPRVIFQPPVLEGGEDVRIYHPHGFLPHPDQALASSDFVILGLRSINLRLGMPHDEWLTMLRHILSSGVGIFVGLSERSFRDKAVAPLLTALSKELKTTRPTGFWIVADGTEKADPPVTDEEFLESNIVPMRPAKIADIPGLLLEICRKAATTVWIA